MNQALAGVFAAYANCGGTDLALRNQGVSTRAAEPENAFHIGNASEFRNLPVVRSGAGIGLRRECLEGLTELAINTRRPGSGFLLSPVPPVGLVNRTLHFQRSIKPDRAVKREFWRAITEAGGKLSQSSSVRLVPPLLRYW